MSHYDEEFGTIKLPAKAVKAVRLACVEAHNAAQERLFERSQQVLDRVRLEQKGKRKVNWPDVVMTTAFKMFPSEDHHEVLRLLLPETRRPLPETGHGPRWEFVRATKPVAPKRKALDLVGKRADAFSFEEASITFKGRDVTWHVDRNNKAVETARRHPVAKAFFRALDAVEWTRGTGGELCGNDEYNEDGAGEGDRGNYVTKRYGPLGEPRRRVFSRGSKVYVL